MVAVQRPSNKPRQWPLAAVPYDGPLLFEHLARAMASMRFRPSDRRPITKTFTYLCRALEGCVGQTLQERWQDFEQRVWPAWLAGQDRPPIRINLRKVELKKGTWRGDRIAKKLSITSKRSQI
jgi:hypothetical protein